MTVRKNYNICLNLSFQIPYSTSTDPCLIKRAKLFSSSTVIDDVVRSEPVFDIKGIVHPKIKYTLEYFEQCFNSFCPYSVFH